jgi:hypothetical protein
MMIHDPAVGVLSRTSSSSRPRTLCGLTRALRVAGRAVTIRLPTGSRRVGWPRRSAPPGSGRSTTTPCLVAVSGMDADITEANDRVRGPRR